MQSASSRVQSDTFRRSTISCKLFFKSGDLGPKHKLAALQYSGNSRINLRLDAVVLRFQVEKRYFCASGCHSKSACNPEGFILSRDCRRRASGHDLQSFLIESRSRPAISDRSIPNQRRRPKPSEGLITLKRGESDRSQSRQSESRFLPVKLPIWLSASVEPRVPLERAHPSQSGDRAHRG